jgi:hypothetical protein
MFCNFCLARNHKSAINSITTETREKNAPNWNLLILKNCFMYRILNIKAIIFLGSNFEFHFGFVPYHFVHQWYISDVSNILWLFCQGTRHKGIMCNSQHKWHSAYQCFAINAECHYAECHCAECFYAWVSLCLSVIMNECLYAECLYAECFYDECHCAECFYDECYCAWVP